MGGESNRVDSLCRGALFSPLTLSDPIVFLILNWFIVMYVAYWQCLACFAMPSIHACMCGRGQGMSTGMVLLAGMR